MRCVRRGDSTGRRSGHNRWWWASELWDAAWGSNGRAYTAAVMLTASMFVLAPIAIIEGPPTWSRLGGLGGLAFGVVLAVAIRAALARRRRLREALGEPPDLLTWAGTTDHALWWLVPFGLALVAIAAFAAAAYR